MSSSAPSPLKQLSQQNPAGVALLALVLLLALRAAVRRGQAVASSLSERGLLPLVPAFGAQPLQSAPPGPVAVEASQVASPKPRRKRAGLSSGEEKERLVENGEEVAEPEP